MIDKPNRNPEPPKSDAATGAGIVVKNAIKLLPYGSLLTDLWQARADRLKEAVAKENEKRLADFYHNLFQGEKVLDDIQANALLDDRDFHALVRACVADIESEKTAAYAALARAIATGRVHETWRRHYILSLRDMSAGELTGLQKAFVARSHQLVPAAGPSMDEGYFLKPAPPGTLEAIVIDNLTAKGFVAEGKLTLTGVNFVETCMKAADLTPAAIGYRAWTGLNVAVLDYQIGDGTLAKLANAICDELRNHCIKSQIIAITRDAGMAHLAYTHAVLLVGDHIEPIVGNLKHLTRFLRQTPLIILSTPPTAPTLPNDLQPRTILGVAHRDTSSVAQEVRRLVLEDQA
jgi:hypothetical protein